MDLLATRLSPILYLHKDEEHFPSTPDHYLSEMDIIIDEETVLNSPTQRELYELSVNNPANSTRARMVPNDPHSTVLFGNSTLDVPVYAFEQKFGNGFIYITYCYFYCYNKSYNVLGLSYVGEHNADIEHITVEVDEESLLPTRYYFSAHGHTTGTWYNVDDLEMERGRPIAYVSKGSHAMYNKAGVIWRLGGVANDHTMKTYRWDPDVHFIEEENSDRFDINQSWIYYPGRWAVDGINGVVNQEWYNELPTKSLNPTVLSYVVWNFIFYSVVILGLVALVAVAGLISHLLKPSFGVDDKQVITGSTLLFGATIYTLYATLILLSVGVINVVSGRRILTTAEV